MADTGERLRESKMTEEKLHVKEELGCRCTGMDALSLLLAGGRAAPISWKESDMGNGREGSFLWG